VIPNPVDTEVFNAGEGRARAKERLGLPTNHPVVLMTAANLENRWKGAAHGVEALNAVAPSRASVILVGENSDRVASQLQCDAIAYPREGDRQKMADYYRAADVTLVPSLEDICPLVVPESMACGTPVLAYATGGIPEVVSHGAGGLVARRGDVAALAAIIRSVIDDAALRSRLAVTARERAVNEFSLTRYAERVLGVYREALTTAAEASR
jgi:glycosyltransferase involved in cell wall biosynthesis